MSYILEALKKAQAERQLGGAPTLHAVPVGAAAPAPARRWPLAAMAAVLAAVLALGAAWWWLQRPPGKPAVQPSTVAVKPAPAPAVPVAPVVSVAPAVSVAPPLAVVPPSQPPKPARPAASAVPPAAPVPVGGERLPTLGELPLELRASIPQLHFGGYMYSTNPADRLILVDKVLRHEGEQVAPGLVLEKLLPKAAQMNYKGHRYLVAF